MKLSVWFLWAWGLSRNGVKNYSKGPLIWLPRVSGRLVRFCTLSGAFLTSVEGDRVPVSDGS